VNRPERAVAAFQLGHNCSEAILSTFAGDFGLPRDTALRLACPFGAGLARRGGTCGAVSGAFMVIGLRYGRVKPEDKASRDRSYTKVREFLQEFQKRNQSTLCRELLGVDLSTDEGYRRAKDEGLVDTRCPQMVRDAAEILEQIL